MSRTSDGSLLKFVLGVVAGAAIGVAYVHWNVSLPWVLALPGQLRDNLVATAVEAPLYDLNASPEVRARALEVLFQTRPRFAAEIDAQAGHPFLTALHRQRAAREARELRAAWHAFDEALAQSALREALQRKHATNDTAALKRAMLMDRLRQRPFLADWLARNGGAPRADDLLQRVETASRLDDQRGGPR